jgi:hypothetical protein
VNETARVEASHTVTSELQDVTLTPAVNGQSVDFAGGGKNVSRGSLSPRSFNPANTACGKCGGYNDRKPHAYCKGCHAAVMREWRKTHSITKAQKIKGSARSLAKVYKRSGLIESQPCVWCTAPDAEMHHPDYSQPLLVVFLCRACHLDYHAGLRWLAAVRRRLAERRITDQNAQKGSQKAA